MLVKLRSKKHPDAVFLCDKVNPKDKRPNPSDVFIAKVYQVVDQDLICEAFVMAYNGLKKRKSIEEFQGFDNDLPDPFDDEPHFNDICPECCKPEWGCTCT